MEVLFRVRQKSLEGVNPDFILLNERINQHNPLNAVVNAMSHETEIQNKPLSQYFPHNCFIKKSINFRGVLPNEIADDVLDVSACSAEWEDIVFSLFTCFICHAFIINEFCQWEFSSIIWKSSKE